jgi:hypothetical protein
MNWKRLHEARRRVADAEAFAAKPGVDQGCAQAALANARQKLFHLERLMARQAASDAGANFIGQFGRLSMPEERD